MPVSRSVLAAALFLALGAPAPVLADYRAYARGQEAAADGDWAEVELEMQQALAANPDPKVRVKLYGQRFAPYVPQYYLGLAAYRQNDCAAALRWFGDAAAAPVIAQVAEFRGVADAARGDCNARLAANKPVTDKPLPVTPDRPVADKPAPDKPAVQTPPVTNKPTPPVAPPVKPVAVPTPVVPAMLQTALQQWLAGRYRDVVAGGTNGLQGKTLAHLHLLRAAAYFAQSEIDPANAASLRASAEQEVRSARRALPAIAPDAGFHSPRFRAFFAATR
ncbi:MAG TPA: hypothetical protein PLB00_09280 [Pseudomonadota bacterium]|nr:hypothetical protein [Pseudomonadota bacterium]